MKSKLGFLIAGIVIGFFARPLWFHGEAQSPAKQTEEAVTTQVREPEKVVQRVVELRPRRIESHVAPKQDESKPSVATSVQKSDTAVAEPASTRGLVINEENVSEMERQRDQLRRYAYTTQTAEGWKIQILPDDKVFLKSGLTSGDLITFESVDSQLQMPDRAQLANRMVAILNSIQR